MIPEALFVPASLAEKHGGSYEVNHLGVVLRVRDGKAEHIGGVHLRHEKNLRKSGDEKSWDLTYKVTEELLPRIGKIAPGTRGGEAGWWLVPEKFVAAFDAALIAASPSDSDEPAKEE